MEPATPSFSDSLEEIRSRLVWRMSFILIGLGIAVTWYVLVRHDLPFACALVPFLLVVFTRIIQVMTKDQPILARRLFVWSMAAHLTGALLVFTDSWIAYIAVPVVFVSAMLISNGSWTTAALFVGVTTLLDLSGLRSYELAELALLLMLTAGMGWISAYTLFTVVHWYSAMQLRSQRLLEETRDHRAELSQSVRSLKAAYETQRHIQFELVWARKHAEDARRLKEQFAANISHELWTPLNLILGYSEVMYLSPEVYGNTTWTPELRRDIHQIYRNSQHLLGLIGDILDLSRFEMTGFNISPEPTALAPFLKETLAIVENTLRGHAVKLDLKISDDLPTLDLDCTRIRQVILNLLNNAYHHAATGIIEIAARREEREIIISVRDSGSGIAADKLPYLFEEFYQGNPSLKRSHSGAGLGLAISKRFVEAHHGRIWVESEEGVGSCFSFALPISDRAFELQAASMNRRSEAAVDAARQNLLVLDADNAAVSLLQYALKDCNVIRVVNERALPEMIVSHHPKMILRHVPPGTQTSPPESLLDMGMPLVECSLPTFADAAKQLGVRACLSKPIHAEVLLDEVERIGHVQNILLAFADRGFALLVERMLRAGIMGCDIRRAYDDAEAVTALNHQTPDLVFLDALTPDNHGLHLLEYMHAHRNFEKVPVIVLSDEIRLGERQESRFVIHQRDGLYPAEILKCINAIFRAVSPRYFSEMELAHP